MEITTSPDVGVPELRYVPDDFDPTDLDALRGLAEALLERSPAGAADLERWIEDWSELGSRVGAGLSRRRIAMTRNTADPALRDRYLAYERDVMPVWHKLDDRLNRHYRKSEHRDGLGARFEVFELRSATRAELFREENVDLQAQVAAVASEYSRLAGTATATFRGETMTLQQCGTFLEDPDRETRAEAFAAISRSLTDRKEQTEDIFERLRGLRGRIAHNAGFDEYLSYRFSELCRFDYGPEDCRSFHEAVERIVVPRLAQRYENRRRRLGVETLRPYDLRVDLDGRDPVRPFEDQDGFVRLVRSIFRGIDPVFEEEFDILVRNGLLDLMSRPGKAPGGYNASVPDIRLPFIFMNAAGSRGDLRTLLHEGGHAFHTLATRSDRVVDLSHPPMEFAEVASMAMEFFGLERIRSAFDDEDQIRTLVTSTLEERLLIFARVAMVDAFQHWIYLNPEHTPEEREREWVALRERFTPGLDWSGLVDTRPYEWHSQLHLFLAPFYYIEYALALIGALQLWRRFRSDPRAAVADYRQALALGGRERLPGLFAAAGGRFATDEATLREVVEDLVERLEAAED